MKYQKTWIASRTSKVYLLSGIEIKGRNRNASHCEMGTQPALRVITSVVEEPINLKLGFVSKLTRWFGLVDSYSFTDASELERINYASPSHRYVHRSPSFIMMVDHRIRNFSR